MKKKMAQMKKKSQSVYSLVCTVTPQGKTPRKCETLDIGGMEK